MRKCLQDAVLRILPPSNYSLHKGQSGRVAVFGGCWLYTGAPYFASMAALRCGIDLVHIFCTTSAGPVIKSYSPDLIVHAIIPDESVPSKDSETVQFNAIEPYLNRMHAVLIGPGIGEGYHRLPLEQIFTHVRQMDIPIIIDADALKAIPPISHLIGYPKAVLTPNAVELQRLYKGLAVASCDIQELCEKLAGVIVVGKGRVDHIAQYSKLSQTALPGSRFRPGGLGDILAGLITAFSAWHQLALLNGVQTETLHEVVVAACEFARDVAQSAEHDQHRSLIASDLLAYIGPRFEVYWNEENRTE